MSNENNLQEVADFFAATRDQFPDQLDVRSVTYMVFLIFHSYGLSKGAALQISADAFSTYLQSLDDPELAPQQPVIKEPKND